MTPSVSCLLVTQPGRESMAIEAAMDCARQTWPDKELVIATDGDDYNWSTTLFARIEEATGGRLSLCLCHVDGKTTLGAIRNASVRSATGDYLIQWDDDDRYHTTRIDRQVRAAWSTSRCVGSCLTTQLYYFVEDRKLYWIDWRYRRPARQSILIPGTLCVRAAAGRLAKYPESGDQASKGEDGNYLGQITAKHVVEETEPMDDIGWLYFRRYHGKNTWGKGRFTGNAKSLGHPVDWLRSCGRKELLEAVLADQGFVTGKIQVMGKDGPAYTIEVQGRVGDAAA